MRARGAGQDAVGSWIDLAAFVSSSGRGGHTPFDELADKIGRDVYIDVAGWHLVSLWGAAGGEGSLQPSLSAVCCWGHPGSAPCLPPQRLSPLLCLLPNAQYLKDVKVGQGLSLAQALAGSLGPKLQGQVRLPPGPPALLRGARASLQQQVSLQQHGMGAELCALQPNVPFPAPCHARCPQQGMLRLSHLTAQLTCSPHGMPTFLASAPHRTRCLAPQGFHPSDLEMLKKVPIKLGAGRVTLPLADLLPAACVADLERICDDYARN